MSSSMHARLADLAWLRLSFRQWLGLLSMMVGVTVAGAALAADIGSALGRFKADAFSETATAIGEIAASGVPHAAALLDALADRRVVVADSGAVFFTDAAGGTFDGLTGAAAASIPATTTVVRTNNRLRGAIQAALGTLGLQAPEPAKRLAAADAVFKARDATALPAIRAALGRERDPRIARALRQAEAAIVLTGTPADLASANVLASPAERSAAIGVLRERGDREAQGILERIATTQDDPLAVQARSANASIESRLVILAGVNNVWYGLSLGSVLLLVAIGLAITFGVMGVINMAHGEMVMIGAYTAFVTQEVFRAYAPGFVEWSLLLSVPLAFLVAALVGIAIERGIIRFLYGRPLETLLATWGVSLILQQAVRTVFGPTNREVSSPSYMTGVIDVMGLQITTGRLTIILFTLAVFALLLFVLKATSLGLQMRAVTQNRKMAASMGIRTGYVDAMTFGLGSGVAGIAGVALTQIDNVSPNLGQSYIIDSFMVVVFGGVGSLWGTFVSAFTLGIANKLIEPLAGAVLAKIAILILLILFIQKRPRGLFALKGRAVEA